MTYDANYFIKKFEAIPEEAWCVGEYEKDGRYCALGFCGVIKGIMTQESEALKRILIHPVCINDGAYRNLCEYKHSIPNLPTPKKRILAALRNIKEEK